MLLDDYKRKYRFRTDTSKERKYLNMAVIITIIIGLLFWFFA